MKKTLLIIVSIFLYPGGLCFAQSTLDTAKTSQKSESRIYVETDPTALFFKGFSLAVRRSSTLHQKMNIGLGIYKVTLPKSYVEANSANVGEGWKANNAGIDFFADYFFSKPNEGLSVGMAVSYYNFNISRSGMEDNYQAMVETVRTGYLWRPLKKVKSCYVFPWIGLSTHQNTSGNDVIVGEKFTLNKWNFVPALQVGVSF